MRQRWGKATSDTQQQQDMSLTDSAREPDVSMSSIKGTVATLLRLQRYKGNRLVSSLLPLRRSSSKRPDQGLRLQIRRSPIPEEGGGTAPVAPSVNMPGRRTGYLVVGDPGLNAGNGTFVPDLESARDHLIGLHFPGEWTLTLSIHGAEDIIATTGGTLLLPASGPLPAGAYDIQRVEQIFAQHADYVAWRDREGPSWLVLNACQVSAPFERRMIEAVTCPPAMGARGQPGRGLGTGCRPNTVTRFPQGITSRSAYNALSRANQQSFLTSLTELNRLWGYYGAPPVGPITAAPSASLPSEFDPDLPLPEEEAEAETTLAPPSTFPNPFQQNLLHYYFDEPPMPGWPEVRVMVQETQFVGSLQPNEYRVQNRVVTNIAFYNRGMGPQGPRFRQFCSQGVAQLGSRTAGSPEVSEVGESD